MELITGVHASAQDCIHELTAIQQFTMRSLGQEMLWVSSMPCCLPADDAIPLGQYGSSNVGRTKTAYRNGLGHRFGAAHANHLRHPLQLEPAGGG